jgi:hypothetical protein
MEEIIAIFPKYTEQGHGSSLLRKYRLGIFSFGSSYNFNKKL